MSAIQTLAHSNGSGTEISLEARMVLKTLEQQSMTISGLERHWRPTWSIDEIRAIVTQLQRQNLIRFTGERVLEHGRYVVQARPIRLAPNAINSTRG
jgi:hypothetical protein